MTRPTFLVRTVAVIAAVALPALAIGGLAWSTSARTDALDRIPVAIVNDDQIVHQPTTTAAGRALSSALIHPTSEQPLRLDWTLTGQEEAHDGLEDGTFQAVLTIPKEFSADVVSSGTDDPTRARVSLQTTADAATTAALSGVVTTAAADALGEQVTTKYLDSTLDSSSSLHDQLSQAADSASSLTDGATDVADGTAQLHAAAAQLASGLDTNADGASALATGVSEAATSSRTLADGSSRVASGASDTAAAAISVADGAERTSAGATSLAASLKQASTQCPPTPAAAELCAQLDAAAQAAAQLDAGAAATAAGTSSLATGSASLRDAASATAAGAGSLASGSETLASSSQQLASGVQQAAAGGEQLASSAGTLAAGSAQVSSGSKNLTSGLRDATEQVPTYTDSEKQAITSVVADPVEVQQGDSVQDGAVAAILGIGSPVLLWLAAAATSGLLLRHRRNAIDQPSSALLRRLLLTSAALGALQGITAFLGLIAVGVEVADATQLALLMVVGSVSFSLIATAVRVLLPRASTSVLLGMLVLQVLCSGIVLPLVTAPQPLQFLGGLLPVDVFGAAVLRTLVGGEGPSTVPAFVSLALWTAAAVIVAVVGARRARRVHDRRRAALARPGTLSTA